MIPTVIKDAVAAEQMRQQNEICLIASENYTSKDVMALQGSVLTNKYAEGYPGKRYYGGCENVDKIEQFAIAAACTLFDARFANVQPHSGSQANAAVYQALVGNEGTILGMSLDAGGHLTHGHPLNISGKRYDFHGYGVNKDGRIDLEEIRKLADAVRPDMIVMGFSAYSGPIDEELLAGVRDICRDHHAWFMFDMAHIAGLVAADIVTNPLEYADVVTTTTHKTLRGPRGGLILWNDDSITKRINSAVFPGMQGGPLMHVIAAKAQCFAEAMQNSFFDYAQSVVENAQAMAETFQLRGLPVIGGGTANHMMLLDVSAIGLTGKEAEEKLERVGIIVNKNMIPNDKNTPMVTSGIRVGTPAMTTRGMTRDIAVKLACHMASYLKGNVSEPQMSAFVQSIVEKCPLYSK